MLTHGFTVDGQGRKMSKSLGNVIAPQTVMETLGADIIRLLIAAAADYRAEMAVSDEILKRMTDSYLRMRNTAGKARRCRSWSVQPLHARADGVFPFLFGGSRASPLPATL